MFRDLAVKLLAENNNVGEFVREWWLGGVVVVPNLRLRKEIDARPVNHLGRNPTRLGPNENCRAENPLEGRDQT